MIVNVNEMKTIEANTPLSTKELINIVGKALFSAITPLIKNQDKIMIICGKGNNGADGLALANLLIKNNYNVQVYLFHKDAKTIENKELLAKLPSTIFINDITKQNPDIIIDCIYGFSFKGSIRNDEKKLFDYLNNLKAFKISIDINSGCEADNPACDPHAFKSDLTLALGYYKPFHMFNKEHQMFKKLQLIALPLSSLDNYSFINMDLETFLKYYPKIKPNAHKGINGKALIIGGSYGMAGATMLNCLGSLCCGMTYLHVALEDTIYPIVSTKYPTVVFHPFDRNCFHNVIENIMHNVDAICYGSGINQLPYQNDILELLLQNSYKTIILDAQAIRLLIDKLFILKLRKPQLIITPHIKEFADLINKPLELVKAHKITYALEFAKEYNTIVVLKDTNTIIVSPSGEIHINTMGNQALARAGSGDLLTGFILSLCALIKDNFLACTMAVWFYNYLCEQITKDHSITCFDLELYKEYADAFFKSLNM